jgi:hypothetical protein
MTGVPAPTSLGRVAAGPGDMPVPYVTSDRPHRVRLANGQVMDVDGFWVEDGLIRFRRFGGMVGVPRTEVVGLLPREAAPLEEQIAARFLGRSGPICSRSRLAACSTTSGSPVWSRWTRAQWGRPRGRRFGRARHSTSSSTRSGGGDGRVLAGVRVPAERTDAERRACPARPGPPSAQRGATQTFSSNWSLGR